MYKARDLKSSRSAARPYRAMRGRVSSCAVFIMLVGSSLRTSETLGQDARDAQQPVSREEFNKLLEAHQQFHEDYGRLRNDNESLRREVESVRTELSALRREEGSAVADRALAEMRADIMAEMAREIERQTQWLSPGATNFVIAGSAVTAFQDREGVDSTFGVGIAPILLWKPTERLMFETEVAFALTDEETEVELDYAHFSYLLNDYLTIGGGKFLIPFGAFWERWHPSWINKLPTMPLIYERGLIGPTGLGVQLRGGAPLGPTKINYAAYVINGPDLRTSFASAGRLGFNNHRDNNNNKAVGGRIGFLPIPELEVGYSILAGRVGDSGSRYGKVDTIIHGFDFSYGREFDAIKGRLDLRAEFIRVDTDDVIFTGPFDPFTFRNRRNGWFLQVAYRPTKVDLKLPGAIDVRKLEFVARYDQIRQAGPGRLGVDHDQLTVGIDYWVTPSAVLKAAYVFDDAHGGESRNGFFLQFAVGF